MYLFDRPHRRSRSASTMTGTRSAGSRGRARLRPRVEVLENLTLLSSFTVNTPDDVVDPGDSLTSLREAVQQANAQPGADVITFALPAGTSSVWLTRGQPPIITESVAINGPGASALALNANNSGGVFEVAASARGVSIRGLTLTGGNASNGGAIRNAGELSVVDAVIAGNTAYNGGGGVYNSGSLSLSGCTHSGNSARRYPGDAASVVGRAGGGIANVYGSVRLDGCTLSGNSATGGGGGVANAYGSVRMTNCTLSGNAAYSGGGLLLDAGGAPPASTFAMLTNCTVAGNSASGGAFQGGGIRSNGGALTLNNTIVADSASGPDLATGGSGTLAGSRNLIETLDAIGSLTGTLRSDPMLELLRNNGGPTWTQALKPGSPARDAGGNALAVDYLARPLASDQRGAPFSRVSGTGVDIGAYESHRLVVDTVLDGVDGDYGIGRLSLREAIALANAAPGADSITFALPAGSVVSLTQGQALRITDPVSVTGPGAAALSIDANDSGGIFKVDPSAGSVTIARLTLENGNASMGGAILNFGNLTVADAVIADNNASRGGGVANSASGTLALVRSIVRNNSAGSGGGVYNAGVMTASNSTISGNSATGDGGGVANLYGSVALTLCTISANGASGGGGIYSTSTAGQAASLSLDGCSVENNWAGGSGYRGGGIEVHGYPGVGGLLRTRSSTVIRNAGYDLALFGDLVEDVQSTSYRFRYRG